MAIESLSILVHGEEGKAFLSEKYAGVIENIQARTISNIFKNTELSGDPDAGTLKAKRFANATSKKYGTARTAGRGDNVKEEEVFVNIDVDREFVEEVENKDIKLLGVEGLVNKRANNHQMCMASELDRAFFAKAEAAGTKITSTKTTVKDRLNQLILTLHKTRNDFVDGVNKELIHVTLSPEAYEEMRDFIDTRANANVQTDVEEFGKYHGVWIYSNINQTAEMIAMCKESIAQPVMSNPYKASKIPLSESFAIELYFHYGTAAVMPDLIYYIEAASGVEGASLEGVELPPESPEGVEAIDLEAMTIEQLKAFAEEKGYQVTKSIKGEIIDEIQAQIDAEV